MARKTKKGEKLKKSTGGKKNREKKIKVMKNMSCSHMEKYKTLDCKLMVFLRGLDIRTNLQYESIWCNALPGNAPN